MGRLCWLAIIFGAVGCAESPPPVVASAAGGAVESVPSAAPAPPMPLSANTVARSAVHAVIAHGLGAFLQHLDLDDQPVLMGGRFHGFRITALHDPAFWNGVDLKPGDVVTSVNGFPIERPEQAQTAFDSLEVASELRVAFDRDGKPHELVYAIANER